MANVYFFPNGNTMFFDDHGEQVPELQKSWLVLYLDFLESKGIDPTQVEFRLPSGELAKPLKLQDNRWTWQVIDDNQFSSLQWDNHHNKKIKRF